MVPYGYYVHLEEEQLRKLAYIQQQTNQDAAELIKQAINQQYEKLQGKSKTPLEIFEELSLVGCFEGDPNLSTNYKTVVTDYLDEKQQQERL